MVKKSMKEKYRNLLNTISGYIVIFLGASLLFNFISSFSSELGSSFTTLLFGVGLIFLGIYVLRCEKWAVILSGVYAIALLINMWFITKLIGGGLIILITNIPSYILIINWWVFKQKWQIIILFDG